MKETERKNYPPRGSGLKTEAIEALLRVTYTPVPSRNKSTRRHAKGDAESAMPDKILKKRMFLAIPQACKEHHRGGTVYSRYGIEDPVKRAAASGDHSHNRQTLLETHEDENSLISNYHFFIPLTCVVRIIYIDH